MKLKSNLSGRNDLYINFSTDRKERKKYLKEEFSKKFKNLNINLHLKKEKEKANSTTQTGQKSLLYSNDEKINNDSQKYLSKTFYNNIEKRKKYIFKKNANLFLLNDILYSRNEINGKLFFYNKNEGDKNNEINMHNIKNMINKKSNRLNKLTLIDICYNSIINKYNKKSNYFKNINNNINMYHYNDLNQRKIEKIIPNINEYLNNNSTRNKNFFQTNFIKCKKNKNNNFLIQNTYNNFNNKYNLNKNNKNKKKFKNLLCNNLKNENIELCLFNSIKNSINEIKRIANNKKIVRRDFSCKASNKIKNNKFKFEKMDLNFNNKDKKISIGMFNYLSPPNRKLLI